MSFDRMQTASFRGVEFEVVSVRDIFDRRVVDHQVPFADGAELEDLGRRPRESVFSVVFYGDDYLTRLGDLLRVLDEGTAGPLVHPLFGRYTARYVGGGIDHTHDERDTARLELTFKEDGRNHTLADLFSFEAAVRELEVDVEAARQAYDDLDEDIPEVEAALADADDYGTDVDDTADDLEPRFDQLRRHNNEAIAATGEANQEPRRTQSLVQSLRDIVESARAVKEQAERNYPKRTTKEIGSAVPLSVLALSLYGDPDREEDLLRLNRVKNPFLVPAGTELKIFAG